MESRVLILDPTSHTRSRSFFTIPAGLKYFTRKLRLLNFRILNAESRPIYFGPKGIKSLVKNITIQDLTGTVIDQLSFLTMDTQGLKNLHMENATQQYLARQMIQNACVSVSAPSSSQLTLTETQGKDSASQIWAHLDISSMLNYLEVRAVANEGLQITIEWVEELSPVNGSWYFSVPPALAVDEVLGNVGVDKQDSFIFTSIVANRLSVPVNPDPTAVTELDVRLQSYVNCFIKNITYFNANQQKATLEYPAGMFNRATYMPYAVDEESLQVAIDGKYLFTAKGINSDARKLANTDYWTGEFCLPSAPSFYYGVKTIDGQPYGLTNPNLGIVMNGNLSYGVFGVNQFVKDNFQIMYRGLLGSSTSTAPEVQQLFFLAEVVRGYNRKTSTVSNVFAPVA
jgi:hypothetical protein